MMQSLHNIKDSRAYGLLHTHQPIPPVYSREAFRAILARQAEWDIRAALEEGNIPSSNVEHAIEWLTELEQKQQHLLYVS